MDWLLEISILVSVEGDIVSSRTDASVGEYVVDVGELFDSGFEESSEGRPDGYVCLYEEERGGRNWSGWRVDVCADDGGSKR